MKIGLGISLRNQRGGVVSYGPELVSNGMFETNTLGWTNTGCTLSVDAGRLKLTATVGVGVLVQSDIGPPVTVVIGQTYRFLGTMVPGTVSDNWIELASAYAATYYIGNSATVDVTFVATTTTLGILLYPASADFATSNPGGVGSTVMFDNISLKRVL